MRRSKEIMTAAGALALAVTIGFVMQNSETARQHYGKTAAPETATDKVEGASVFDEMSGFEQTSAGKDTGPLGAMEPLVEPRTFVYTATSGCNIEAISQVRPGAMVEVSLKAPCLADEALTLHHMGVMFRMKTDETGYLNVQVPAFAASAIIVMEFDRGDGAVLQASVPDVYNYRRTAVQWGGYAGLHLTAEGTVARDETGFVTRLGQKDVSRPQMVAVYTFPAHTQNVSLEVNSVHELRTCGTNVDAQMIELNYGRINTSSLVIELSDCDVLGVIEDETQLVASIALDR